MPVRLAEGLDYKSLFEAGVGLTQNAAFQQWTDYNVHDPGVTILEQLCYALTDLAYRVGWPIEDLLARAPETRSVGEAFADQQAPTKETTLFKGPEILTSAPVTQRDFRDLLFAQVPNLQNAWLRPPSGSRAIQGLYAIDIQVYDPPDDGLNPASPGAWQTYLAARPLCEDVEAIAILGSLPIKIDARVDIDNSDTANDIAANVIATLQTGLLPGPTYTSLSVKRAEGRAYDEIFEGPSADVLVINSSPDRRPLQLAVEQFARIAASAAGVDSIRGLELEFSLNGRPERSISIVPWGADRAPTINVDATLNAPSDFQLLRGGVSQKLELGRVRSNIEHRKYMEHVDIIATIREVQSDPYNRAPPGVFRWPEIYASIRDQFPRIYGLGPFGAPRRILLSQEGRSGREDGRHRRIAQLGTYLSIFEQVMANHLAQLANIPTLFSLSEKASKATYFWQKLDSGGSRVAGRGALGDVMPQDYPTELAALVKRQDPKLDRRARLLDHLLARFNEAFDDDDWKVAQEVSRRSSAELDADTSARNAAKVEFLADYVFVGGFRGAGCDYSRPPTSATNPVASDPGFGRAMSGLERRVKLLTGIAELYVVEHILLRNRADETDGDLAEFHALRLSVIAPRSKTEDAGAMETFIERTVEDNCPAHIEADCLFLDASLMNAFKPCYEAWRGAYAEAFALPSGRATIALDSQSQRLKTFLMEQRQTMTT